MRTSGVPVVILDRSAATELVAPLGVDLAPFIDYDARSTRWKRSASRELGVTARVSVPLSEQTSGVASHVAEVAGAPDELGRVVVWAERTRTDAGDLEPDRARADILATLAGVMKEREAPFIFVDHDPRMDPSVVRKAFGDRRIALVIYLGSLEGGVLRFRTLNGDLVPAFDLYAEEAGARHELTRATASSNTLGAVRPFIDVKTVVISTNGPGDPRADTAAVIAYVAGRLALGAPELPR